jgi:hypothetical protein
MGWPTVSDLFSAAGMAPVAAPDPAPVEPGGPHARVRNPALYADRTVQDWHFDTFPKDWSAIDLDLMGTCRTCSEPLYLIEATTNPNKPVTMLYRLARRADLEAFTIWHRDGEVRRGRMIYPHRLELADPFEIETALMTVRARHTCRPRR